MSLADRQIGDCWSTSEPRSPGDQPERRDYTRPRWICTSSGRLRRPPSGQLWMPSSGPLRRAGAAARAIRQTDGHAAPAVTRPAVAARPAAAGTPRRPVAGRLDQPAGAELHLPAPRRPPGRCLRRRDVLRDVRDERRGRRPSPMSATTSHAGSPARSRSAQTSSGRSGRRASRHGTAGSAWLAVAVPGALRARAGRDVHGRRARPRPRRGRRARSTPPPDRRAGLDGRRSASDARRTRSAASAASRRPGLRLLAGSASSTRRHSTTTARQRRVRRTERARSRSGPSGVIEEVTASNSSVAAAPRSRPDGNGPPWRPSRPAALPRLQRRRVGAGHVQGSGPAWRATRSRVVEAMAIAAFATGAVEGLPLHPRRVPGRRGAHPRRDRARPRGRAARPDILGSGFDFDIEVRRGAGAYICGEETALFESIEGKRGEPRNKPPFPVEVGLFGKPTAVNNVETLVNVLADRRRDGGAAPSRAIGTEASTGPKLFCLSGQRRAARGLRGRRSGRRCASSSRSAGGVPGGRAIRAVLLGGAAGVFVGPEALDTPLTFEAHPGDRRDARARASSWSSTRRPTSSDTLRRIARFFRDESCGQCVPCRVGTVRQEELLARLAAGSRVRRPRPTSSHSSATSARRCATPRSAGSARPRPRRSNRALRQPGLVAL